MGVIVVIVCLLAAPLASVANNIVQYGDIAVESPPSRRVLPPRKAYLAACVIAKDVHPDDMTEWLVHHLALGVGHVYWYDHGSATDVSRHAAPFVQAGQLTWMRVHEETTTETKQNVQLPTYHHCADMYSTRHEWMMFIDADEFLWFRDAQQQEQSEETAEQGVHYPLHTFLQQYEQYAGLSVNWLLYGSSGHQTRPKGMGIVHELLYLHLYPPLPNTTHIDTMLRSYTQCVDRDDDNKEMSNGHLLMVKTIVHTARLPTPFRFYHPHGGSFVFPADSQTPGEEGSGDNRQRAQRGQVVDELFRPLAEPHLTESHTSQRITILHFILRSRQEFEHKISIGAADGTRKGMGSFDYFDQAATANCSVVIKDH